MIKVIAAVIGLWAIGARNMTNQPRGIRNNNPGNVRWDYKTQWQGMTGADDAGYMIFTSPEYGIRAMARVLRNYGGRGVNTIATIITTWAPAADNNPTGDYIKHVSQRLHKQPGEIITREDWPELIEAIILHENGQQPYSRAQILKGISMS